MEVRSTGRKPVLKLMKRKIRFMVSNFVLSVSQKDCIVNVFVLFLSTGLYATSINHRPGLI